MRRSSVRWLGSAILLCSVSSPASAADPRLVESAGSGAWSAPRTWKGNAVPAAGDRVLVRTGHVVTYDVDSETVLRAVHVSGTLTFAPDRDTRLEVGLLRIEPGDRTNENGFDCVHDEAAGKGKPASDGTGGQPGFSALCLCCESKAALLVGTPERPVEAGHRALIRLHFVEGLDKESFPAIVCCGGRMDLHGAPLSRSWTKLGADVAAARNGDAGTTGVLLSEPVAGWRVGDQVVVTTSGRPAYGKSGTEESTIAAIDGARLELGSPLVHPHLGTGEFRSEVANLSRNVIVESAEPEGVRGHVMYHAGSAGSISHVEFRHLGKEGVLGRYNLHYHLCGDSMRGASIVGASFHHSRNRWLTVHGTNRLVVRDCVGHESIGHGFFLEDGTEVDNVFDRNLAVRARAGLPLPRQILPFDANSGAGFWFANAHNTFTGNVAVECRHYGFRFEATPRAGVVGSDGAPVKNLRHGDPRAPFDLRLPIRQPDGTVAKTDVRTLPFVRFEDNESHGNGHWGLNIGEGVEGGGPDPRTPFVLRRTRIWSVVGGFGVQSPHVLLDGMTVHDAAYGVRASKFLGQDWRNVSINSRGMTVATLAEYLGSTNGAGSARHRQPGWPKGTGDGGATFQSAEIEVARLEPVDTTPPSTVVTETRRVGRDLVVRGTTADDGPVAQVTVNGLPVTGSAPNYARWEIVLKDVESGPFDLEARSVDAQGNAELLPHRLSVLVK